MNSFLIITHSTLAEGFYNSTKFLSGLTTNVKFIDAYIDESDWTKEAEEIISSQDKDKELIVLTDIYGGSVNQKMTLMLAKYHFILITGVNLPLVLSLVLETQPLTKEKCKNLVEEARKQLQIIEPIKSDSNETDSDFLS